MIGGGIFGGGTAGEYSTESVGSNQGYPGPAAQGAGADDLLETMAKTAWKDAPATVACTDPAAIKQVQMSLSTAMTGVWDESNQKALESTKKTFRHFSPGCTGNPPAAGAKTGGSVPASVPSSSSRTPASTPAAVPQAGGMPSWMSSPLFWAGCGAVLLAAYIKTKKPGPRAPGTRTKTRGRK